MTMKILIGQMEVARLYWDEQATEAFDMADREHGMYCAAKRSVYEEVIGKLKEIKGAK